MKELKWKLKNGPSITYRYEEGISDEKAAEAVSDKQELSPERTEKIKTFLLGAREASPEEWPMYMEKMGDLIRKIFLVNTDINYITPRILEKAWSKDESVKSSQTNQEEIDNLFHCNYFSASEILKKHDAEHEKIDDPDPLTALKANMRIRAALATWQNFSCAFFFATHTDLKPSGKNCLTEQNKTDLIDLHERLKAFLRHYFEENGEPEVINDEWGKAAAAAFHEFITLHNNQNELPEPITNLHQTEFVSMITSKAFNMQPDIAMEGARGYDIDVGGKGRSNAIITAIITGKDGQEYKPEPMQMALQETIGQMAEESGLPLIVTPAQIYRKFAGLSLNAKISEQQEQEVENALDILMESPASIDFIQQLQKHTKIKHRPGLNYESGWLQGNLITGVKIGRIRADGTRETCYKIHEMPLYYTYSATINQIKQVRRELISESAPKRFSIKEKAEGKKPALSSQIGARSNTRNVLMRRYIVYRIDEMEKSLKKPKVSSEKVQRKISFDTIAEKCGTQITSKTIRTIRENTEKILNDLQRSGNIKGFEIYKKGRKLEGVEILF